MDDDDGFSMSPEKRDIIIKLTEEKSLRSQEKNKNAKKNRNADIISAVDTEQSVKD